MAKQQKSVVVTGVSTGIGWGATKVLTQAGFRVFGSVRKEADAKKLALEFGPRFVPLVFDVTDEKGARAAAATVRAALGGETLFGLVNNAGIAVAGPLLYMAIDEFRNQLEVNLTGVVIATQAFAPLLGVDKDLKGEPGRIVNISSVGGRNATPFIGAYNTSKFGLEGLSEALRREMMPFKIDVIVIAPGAVATAIWGKTGEGEVAKYANTPYAAQLATLQKLAAEQGARGLKPEQLGEAIKTALTAPRPKVRYTVTPEPVQNFVLNTVPKRTADKVIARRLGLLPGK
ncbi:MAG: SDR family NAD(P)-dependent oxidoreductase [Alphaproteobacteria bacterium]|nr:SDR family NAD(P)-dependent oxidoreductase [Alphaproteobacteria bacterium]